MLDNGSGMIHLNAKKLCLRSRERCIRRLRRGRLIAGHP
ncbi:hypothetical protein DF3PA_130007 [Candidatus Defluviicoccus seviourii]|uniref:Uncharacterized protein n=1 Tax=Candidatus Defluviicoccus seviourii TaxID=2565273 RepID=A0A564WBK7_9PROT|nr:hypothetical protein DF3PA_130007 [Candidatus Defluviicoccus seviourii]